MRNVLWLAMICATLSGCSDKLSRGSASRLISESLGLPSAVTGRFPVGEWAFTPGTNSELDYLIANAQMKATRTREGRPLIGPSYVIYQFELTESGRQYKVGETTDSEGWGRPRTYVIMKTADQAFGEILGMHEIPAANAAEVEFTLTYKNVTPFGIAKGLQEGQAISRTATFVKYDDGWRIER